MSAKCNSNKSLPNGSLTLSLRNTLDEITVLLSAHFSDLSNVFFLQAFHLKLYVIQGFFHFCVSKKSIKCCTFCYHNSHPSRGVKIRSTSDYTD